MLAVTPAINSAAAAAITGSQPSKSQCVVAGPRIQTATRPIRSTGAARLSHRRICGAASAPMGERSGDHAKEQLDARESVPK